MIPFLTENEALSKFQKAAELLARNKVNKSNAFENRLIDELDKIFEESSLKSSDDKWTYFSTVIDACGRIYGYCVDYIHEETYKILSGCSRTAESYLPEEKPPIFQKKCIIHGNNTLEPSDSNMTFKDLDRFNSVDSNFAFLKRAYDSTDVSKLLINKLSVNGLADITLDSFDEVVGSLYLPVLAEVNLEGIVDFSEKQLLDVEIYPAYLKCEYENSKIEFSQVWQDINGPVDLTLSRIESSEESEEEQPKIGVDIESRILQEFSIDFIQNSEKIIFSKDFLVSGVTCRPKKRKKKEPLKHEIPEPYSVLRIEEIEEINETNLVDLKKVEEKKVERGYKESRLCKLFTRNGKFVETTFVSSEPFTDPLCVSPLTNWKPLEVQKTEPKFDMNIKVLKDTVKKVIDVKSDGNFRDIVQAVNSEYHVNAEGVSIPACFITLLHLANDNSLMLQQMEGSNFIIKKDNR